jgi:Uroporphyrinogen decarboxylase (URO-D)
MLSSKQIMDQAMRRQRPARVPVMCQLANGHTILNTGVHPIDYFVDNDVWADCLVRMRELYDFDGILCHKPGRVPHLWRLVDRVDRDLDVPTLHLTDGSRIECTRDDDAYYKAAADFRYPTLDEIDLDHPLDWAPESFRAFQWSKATFDFRAPEEIPDEAYGLIDRVLARCGDEYSVHGEVRAPLDHFVNLLGIEEGMIALLVDPDRTERLLETCTAWSVALARGLVRRGARAIKISSPFAGSSFLSPDMYERYIVPTEGRIAAAVAEEGGVSYTHTCGAIGDRLELIMSCGVSGIECLDPPPLGNVELADAVATVGHQLFIKGNIDPVNTLLRGDARKVTEDVSTILETAGHALDGFILSSACSVAPPAPPDNIKRAVELCRRFTP